MSGIKVNIGRLVAGATEADTRRQFEDIGEAVEGVSQIVCRAIPNLTFWTDGSGRHDQMNLGNPGFDKITGVQIGRLQNKSTNADSAIDLPLVNWQWTADGDILVTRLGSALSTSQQYEVTFLVFGTPSHSGRVGKTLRGN